jgi:hypothetical protein
MRYIGRRPALIAGCILLCLALIAISPRGATTQAEHAIVVAQGSGVHTDQLISPFERPVPVPVPLVALSSEHFSTNAMALEGPASAQEFLDLELVPSPEVLFPTAKPRARLAKIVGYGPRMRGKLLLQTQRIDVYVGTGTFNARDVADVAWKLESLLIQNESGFYPTKLGRRISIGFYSKGSAPSAGTRGIAYTDAGRIEIFYNSQEDISAAFTIASHEMAHQLQNERYGDAVHSRSDMILLEGQATWVAGVRWLKEYGVPSWRGRANQLYHRGVPLTLVGAQRYGSDNAYELWASFVSYIYRRYGMATLDELYRSSRGRAVGSADYKGVLGKTLPEITESWRTWVLNYEPPPSPTPTPIPVPATPTPVRSDGR